MASAAGSAGAVTNHSHLCFRRELLLIRQPPEKVKALTGSCSAGVSPVSPGRPTELGRLSAELSPPRSAATPSPGRVPPPVPGRNAESAAAPAAQRRPYGPGRAGAPRHQARTPARGSKGVHGAGIASPASVSLLLQAGRGYTFPSRGSRPCSPQSTPP